MRRLFCIAFSFLTVWGFESSSLAAIGASDALICAIINHPKPLLGVYIVLPNTNPNAPSFQSIGFNVPLGDLSFQGTATLVKTHQLQSAVISKMKVELSRPTGQGPTAEYSESWLQPYLEFGVTPEDIHIGKPKPGFRWMFCHPTNKAFQKKSDYEAWGYVIVNGFNIEP